MRNLLRSYAEDLNDAYPGYEFSLWSEATLLEYFNEALCLIATHRPDMFTELKVAQVDACDVYLDTCGCVKVLDVLGQCDKDGRVLRPIQKRETKGPIWAGAPKKRTVTDKISSYELLEKSNYVRVFPTNLDPTKDLYVLIRCSVDTKHYEVTDTAPDERCAFLVGARHYVLFNAKMKDGEFSQAMKDSAKEHRDMFFGILKLVSSADEAYINDKPSR